MSVTKQGIACATAIGILFSVAIFFGVLHLAHEQPVTPADTREQADCR